MDIDCKDLFVKNTLFCDYVSNNEALRSFYRWNPHDSNDWKEAMSTIQRYPFHRSRLADILLRQNEAFGCGEKTVANIDLLKNDDTFVVITGQQAGLFTGPLLTIYKTITTIKLAEQLHKTYENKFIPVFWIVSDDHDFAEVNHLFVVTRENDVVRLEYKTERDVEGYSVGKISIDQNFESFLEQYAENTPDTEFKDSVFEILRETYVGSQSFATGFARLMATLFADYGLVLVDPMDSELAGLTLPIFEREIKNPAESTTCALQASERLKDQGYHQQIDLRSGRLNLFIQIEGRRCSVSVNGNTFKIEGRTYTQKDLLSLLKSSPESFSPNVVLRPVVRSHIIPTAAYIGGPAEVSYFAQLKGIFEAFDVPAPVVSPRASATLVEAKVRRILDKYTITPLNIYDNPEGIIRKLVEDNLPETFQTVFQEVDGEIEKLFRSIRDAVVPIDHSLEDLVVRSQHRLTHDVGKIEKKAIQAQKRSEEILVQQIQKVSTHLFPNGSLQERVLNIVPFLILYGPDFVKRLYEAIDVNTKQHQMIDI